MECRREHKGGRGHGRGVHVRRGGVGRKRRAERRTGEEERSTMRAKETRCRWEDKEKRAKQRMAD